MRPGCDGHETAPGGRGRTLCGMTPRRPLRHALLLVVGGIAATAVVGCGNGMQVAGPGEPEESVVSGHASPSAGETPTSDPSASQTADKNDDGADSGKSKGSDGQQKGGSGKSDRSGKSGQSGKSGSDDSGKAGSTGPGSDSGNKPDGGSADGSGKSEQPEDKPTSATDPKSKQRKGRAACELGDLSVGARIPAGSGAAGSSYVLITFTNTSGKACTMYGYAGVSFVGDKNGTQLGKPAARERSADPRRMKLSDGEVQTELLRIANAGNWDAAECAPTTADGFRVYPPGSYTSAYVKFSIEACQSKSVRQMTVYPVGTKS